MIVDRIRELCEKRGTNFSAVEKALGLANASLKKTNEKTQASRLKAIADYFGVSVEYLLTGEESEGWYLDNETAEIAQQVYDDPDLRMLFDASRSARPEDIRLAADLLRRLKETNPDG